MQQTFEYYTVDPGTWKDVKRLDNVKSCTINRDAGADTLGSASFDMLESPGECYIRVYLITIQNGVTERHPLGTFLVQTPSISFNGKIKDVSLDAYTPLIELKENPPPIGYHLLKEDAATKKPTNVMDEAYKIVCDNVRAPVVKAESSRVLYNDFIANTNDNWLTFTRDLIANAKYSFDLDELGRILFAPKQETAALQPVWTYDDGNSSILCPSITMNHDIYGVPNVVEVVYSNGNESYFARVVNDDSNSPISTVNRGREIIHRVTNPEVGIPSEAQIQEYAKTLLKELSSIEYTVTYTHGYCGTRLGDCIRLNYSGAGMTDIKARIISQSINCTPGCQVSETAAFTTKLWG